MPSVKKIKQNKCYKILWLSCHRPGCMTSWQYQTKSVHFGSFLEHLKGEVPRAIAGISSTSRTMQTRGSAAPLITDREGCSLPLTGKAARSQTLLKTKAVQLTTGITEGQRCHRHQNREMKRERHLSPRERTISNKMKTMNLFKDQRIHR